MPGVIEVWQAVDRAIQAALEVKALDEWDENHLTLSWLASVRDVLHGLGTNDRRGSVRCRLMKQRGLPEHKFGDVAVLVRIGSDAKEWFEGVGLLEAKRRYHGSRAFDALDFDQTDRMLSKTRYPQLLLYDWEPVLSHRTWRYRHACGANVAPMSIVAPGTPMRLARRKDTSLYRFAQPLSEVLVHRYLVGLDLDPDRSVITDVSGFADLNEVPTYVLTIVVGPQQLELPQVNEDIFALVD